MENFGIFIGRLNPPHIGHIKIIKTSLIKTKKTIIFLGSKDLIDEKNPFSYEERKYFIEKIFKNEIKRKKIIINYIKDYPNDKLWCEKLGKKIKKYIKNTEDKISFFGGDFKNDSAILAIKDNIKSLEIENIDFIEIYRNNFLSEYGEEISSTNLRNLLKEKNFFKAKKIIYKGVKNLIIKIWKEKYNF